MCSTVGCTGVVDMFLLVVICIILIFYYVVQWLESYRQYPPGPISLPLIGNLISVLLEVKKYECHHTLWQAWARKYGKIIGLKLGFVNVVVVSGRDLIKEVSFRDVFEGRPDGFFYTMRSFGEKLGIVFSDGPAWNKTRRFVLKYLKSYGYNSRFMDNYIAEECRVLVRQRERDAGQPVLVNDMFHIPIVNILWRLVAGVRYDLEDVRLKKLCSLITRLFKAVDMSGGVLNFMPFLRHFIPNYIGYTELKSIHNTLHEFLAETIKQHKQNIDTENPRDVIDACLIEMMKNKDQALTYKELQVVCLDLLEAGMETVSNTAVFMLLHIVRNDTVQQRLQEEIKAVIGQERFPTLNDRIKMPYTEAVLLESLRISSVAAMGIPHMALKDTQLGNYNIPKGTFILMSLYDLHNGGHWKDPDVFKPERFLTKDRNVIQDDWLMPFGTGKRRCIGEGLARAELFMFVTHLLQKFSLKIPEGESLPSTEPVNGLSLSAKPFKIIFEPRI
ncbi:hypothetical protein O3G_MSEX011399 [Manduca sexta]|uniref:Cytochrome P450 n=3 Tax=Manduca sexta TaxID=7130 RepID=A0A922CVI9_MANSE|nr:hypothetical protein O3G_MSEX011399 [Manduca sexta]KAG6459439.1 hypothetical protein O3G_MSEX011399 [Manduca sexta]